MRSYVYCLSFPYLPEIKYLSSLLSYPNVHDSAFKYTKHCQQGTQLHNFINLFQFFLPLLHFVFTFLPCIFKYLQSLASQPWHFLNYIILEHMKIILTISLILFSVGREGTPERRQYRDRLS